jgi:hypothetical protein
MSTEVKKADYLCDNLVIWSVVNDRGGARRNAQGRSDQDGKTNLTTGGEIAVWSCSPREAWADDRYWWIPF